MSIEKKKPVPSDIEIAQAAKIKPILQIAEAHGISAEYLDPYGMDKAKVRLEFLTKNATCPSGPNI
jgi:formyltetrahydrofolate synthetase